MKYLSVLAYTAFLFLLNSCSQQSQNAYSEENVLVRVDDEVITAMEFKMNYEFGFNHLMRSNDRKMEYLMHMTNELVLAQEGYRHGLDTLLHIQQSVDNIREERIIEQVFEDYVLSKIEISEDEIIEEANRSAVAFEYKFIPAQSKEHANFLKIRAEQTSFDEVLANFIDEFYSDQINLDKFTSEEVEVYDVDPEIFESIKDLELNQPSDPVYKYGNWYIFAVSNITRTPISPHDYTNKKHSARKIIYNRKAVELAETFVSSMMEPKDVVTKRAVFNLVNEALMSYYERELPNTYMWNVIEENWQNDKELEKLYRLKDKILVEFDGESWSVEEFFSHFNAGRYALRTDGIKAFKARFSNLIAITVRDKYLLELAETDRINNNPHVERDVKKWEQKWVFQEMRKRVLDDIQFTRHQVKQFYNENRHHYSEAYENIEFEELPAQIERRFHRDFLNRKLIRFADSLKTDFPVEVNYAMLDTLELTHSQANPNMTFALFKQNSNRLAFPIVDPQW